MEYVFVLIGEDESGTFFQFVDGSTEEEARSQLSKRTRVIERTGGSAKFLFSKEGVKEKFREALSEAKRLAIEECETRKIRVPFGLVNL